MNQKSSFFICVCVFALSSAPAYAYIDPGTGSALIQGLIAAVAAIGITLKLYWYRIIRFLGFKRNDALTEASSESSNDDRKP